MNESEQHTSEVWRRLAGALIECLEDDPPAPIADRLIELVNDVEEMLGMTTLDHHLAILRGLAQASILANPDANMTH